MNLINRSIFFAGSSAISLGLFFTGAALVAASGCGGSRAASADGGADMGSTCSAAGTGTGMLAIHVAGLPAGTAAAVKVSDSAGIPSETVTADQTLTLAAGGYSVTADRVAVADPIARTAYQATIGGAGGSAPCVRSGTTLTVTVTYAKIASSNKVWSGNATGGTAPLLGFAAANLGASGSPAATVAAETVGPDGFAFDAAGNLWAVGGTAFPIALSRYPAASLGSSGAKVADLTISDSLITRGAPGPVALAFDSYGGLWVSVVFSQQVVYYSPRQVAAGGTASPAMVLKAIEGPAGLAFDSSKNLWVASGASTVLRFDAARLPPSSTAVEAMGADLEITAGTPPPVIGTLSSPIGLAFDGVGNLWVNYDGVIVRLEAASLAGTGTVALTPAVQITLDVASLPEGLVFDEGGGLWVAYTQGKLGRLGPTQLTSSGSKAPATVIASPDFGYATWVGIYPAPAALPLYHRLP